MSRQVAVLLDHAPPLVGHGVPVAHSRRPRPASPRSPRARCPWPRRCSHGRGERGVGGPVGDDDELGVVAAALLAHGLDRDVVLGEARSRPRRARRRGRRRRSRRGSGSGSPPSAAPRRSAYADSPAPRVPASRLRATVTRSPSTALAVGRAAGAGAVEHQLAGGLGLDEDRVVGLADAGQRVACAGSSPGAPGRRRPAPSGRARARRSRAA